MTLEQLIRQAAEEHLQKASSLFADAALTQDIWLRAINREKADVYSLAADSLLTALRDAEDVQNG